MSRGRRVRQGLVGIVITAGAVAFTAGAAEAHHADITATVACDAKVTYTVTDWATTGAGAFDPDIAVAYNTGGGWVALPSGAFSAGHTAFSGSFTPATHTPGTLVGLRAIAAAAWADGVAAGDTRNAQVTIPPLCPPPPTTTTTVVPTTTTKPVTTTTKPVTTTTHPVVTATTVPTTTTTAVAAVTTTTVEEATSVVAPTTTIKPGPTTTTTTPLAVTGSAHVTFWLLIGLLLVLIGLLVVVLVKQRHHQA